jgi:RND family efflux transporter MFP subunit
MRTIAQPRSAVAATLLTLAVLGTPACFGGGDDRDRQETAGTSARLTGTTFVVKDTTLPDVFSASGTAEPIQQATLSTRLMASVTSVLVKEGDAVSAGQLLVRLDSRDLDAREAQVAAGIANAEAVHAEAVLQASRIRALYEDSAATRAQLDAVETGLARAEAGLEAARAAAGELGAAAAYATIRAPFAGIVTRRFVDAGAFAAPGAPLVSLQDASQLRISATAAPDAVRGVRRGEVITARIEGRSVDATVEGVVPAEGGNLYRVNALVPNPVRGGSTREFLAGSAATLELPSGSRSALVVPANAIVRRGDLTGVTLRTSHGDELRWIRLGASSGTVVEVTAGLRAGDEVVVPTGATASTASGKERN